MTDYQNPAQVYQQEYLSISGKLQTLTWHDPSIKPEFDVMPDTDNVKSKARTCANIALAIWSGSNEASERFEALQALCASQNVKMPVSRFGMGPKAKRLIKAQWWERQLHVKARREWEAGKIAAGEVSERRQLYCTDQAVHIWRAMRRRNQEMMQEVFVFNDDGWLSTLGDIAKHSLANPAVRRAEMMTRLRGLEEYAQAAGHGATFLTITCPSKFHANSGKYNGATPKEAQEYLCKVWARIRAQLAREDIEFYGFRVAEPHNDGCPHWHMILFAPPGQLFRIEAVCSQYALAMDGNEPGAQKRRFTRERIKLARGESGYKGGAVAYIAKYISKNIDGKREDGQTIGEVRDRDGNIVADDAITTAERVLAWSSFWGIRQFQQVGGALIGPYRELRRIHWQITASATLELARQHADQGEFGAYLEAVKAIPDLQTKKRCLFEELYDAGDMKGAAQALNQYGEPTIDVIGVMGDGVDIITRRDDWHCMTETMIHAAYETACDEGERIDFWCDLVEVVGLIRLERERVLAEANAPPDGGLKGAECAALDLCQ